MPDVEVAHIHEQGQDLIIVPWNASFGAQSETTQDEMMAEIQAAARSAGLKGTVCVVWLEGSMMYFKAPQPWHPFFRSLKWSQVLASLNGRLSW